MTEFVKQVAVKTSMYFSIQDVTKSNPLIIGLPGGLMGCLWTLGKR